MENLTLTTKYRTDMSKSATKAIRRNNGATCTVYGHRADSVSVEVAVSELAAMDKAAHESGTSIINLIIEGAPTDLNGPVVLKTMTKNPLTRKLIDVQFQRISMTEKVTLVVPIAFVGDAPGLTVGGVLEEITNELSVRALPADLPYQIEVDISALDVDNIIRVGDLVMAEGVEIMHDEDTNLIACINPLKITDVAEETAAEDEDAEEVGGEAADEESEAGQAEE